jgi:hypothetical protein
VSEEDRQQTPAERSDAEVRAAEIRAEVAVTDERRAEEEVARQQEEVKKAEKRQEELAQKEREAEAEAKRATEEAERARQRAGEGRPAWTPSMPFAGESGGAPGLMERTEVQVGAAFAGAFVLARILKRMFD